MILLSSTNTDISPFKDALSFVTLVESILENFLNSKGSAAICYQN